MHLKNGVNKKMKRICNQCNSEMVDNCSVSVEGALYGIRIKRRGKGLFNSVSSVPKAAVCPNCGTVVFYVEDYKNLVK
jgi:uncharacterized OB-fold protein